MPRLTFQTLLDAPLEAVWAFHEEIELGLRTLSPPEVELQITRADKPAAGAMVIMRLKLPPASLWGGRTRWVARFTDYQPPAGDPPARTAGFTDEQVEGPFARWRHTHRFEEILDEGRPKVRAIDIVEYTPPLGPIGWIIDKLFLRRRINRMFARRQGKMRENLTRRPGAVQRLSDPPSARS